MLLEEAELLAGMDTYFEQAGWEVASGIPTRATLEDTGLGWVADELGI
jgi:hypothetical protein